MSSILGIKVSGCYIYPLKSGSGISVDKLELTQRGPKNDRLWLLVQNQGPNVGKFITQRDKGCEKLALVKAFPNGLGDTKFSTPDGGTLVVSVDDLSCYDSVVHIWGNECVAMDAGNAIANWFSDYLDQKDNQKEAHNMALIKYFDAYQAFCLDLSLDSVLKGDLYYKYK